MQAGVLAILLFTVCAAALCMVLLALGGRFGPRQTNAAKRMPYESGMDPIHDARRQFDFRFYLLAIAFLVFDVELLFLYPWAVTGRSAVDGHSAVVERHSERSEESVHGEILRFAQEDMVREPGASPDALSLRATCDCAPSRHVVFGGVMVFMGLLVLGFIYDWRKGVFRWR